MKIALMQPYFFPYIGYYQLVHSVDEFVFYDDAAFIKQGYINRNRILLGAAPHNFSLAVKNVSSFRPIKNHDYLNNFSNFKRQLYSSYSKAPNFKDAIQLVEQVLDESNNNVAHKNASSITTIFDYLGIEKKFSFSSDLIISEEIRGQNRVIEICKLKSAIKYINSPGGKSLYNKKIFSDNYIELSFIESEEISYKQKGSEFTPNLSMIDMLMWCDKASILKYLSNYNLS
ncbi:MAG: WbqC family protein [Giesbergeria sp.]|uniref:WbqC family protein n=1 Tax=Giesbergeria sp. TaxID=2818473 RepID=UPI0026233EF4|nr:WbqC family protein [Giesbergeria sp.]MDD2608885.1 WbqC family protein [Giesbergeria sp.]